jgi:hypothetical protein
MEALDLQPSCARPSLAQGFIRLDGNGLFTQGSKPEKHPRITLGTSFPATWLFETRRELNAMLARVTHLKLAQGTMLGLLAMSLASPSISAIAFE